MSSLSTSCCLVWNRQLLDRLVSTDEFIGAVMSNLIARDVTNKAYQAQVTLLTMLLLQLLPRVTYCCIPARQNTS